LWLQQSNHDLLPALLQDGQRTNGERMKYKLRSFATNQDLEKPDDRDWRVHSWKQLSDKKITVLWELDDSDLCRDCNYARSVFCYGNDPLCEKCFEARNYQATLPDKTGENESNKTNR